MMENVARTKNLFSKILDTTIWNFATFYYRLNSLHVKRYLISSIKTLYASCLTS